MLVGRFLLNTGAPKLTILRNIRATANWFRAAGGSASVTDAGEMLIPEMNVRGALRQPGKAIP